MAGKRNPTELWAGRRRRRWLTRGAALGAAALVAACGADRLITPADRGNAAPDNVLTNTNGGGRVVEKVKGDTTWSEFVVSAQRNEAFTLAKVHRIEFPAYSICDPLTADYQAGNWDAPCTATSKEVKIVAKSWTDASGRPYIDFQPALRFVPQSADKPRVTVYLKDRDAAEKYGFEILFCTEPGNCVDESVADPSLATQKDSPNGMLYRPIKHFSGYNIAAGRLLE